MPGQRVHACRHRFIIRHCFHVQHIGGQLILRTIEHRRPTRMLRPSRQEAVTISWRCTLPSAVCAVMGPAEQAAFAITWCSLVTLLRKKKNMDPAYKTNAELETPTATHTFTHPVGSKGKSTAIHSMCLRASASGNTLVIVKISTPMRPLFPFEIVAFCQDVTQLPRLIVTRSCLSRLSSAVRSAGRRARVRFRTVQVDQKKAPALHFVITDDRAARMVGGERVREAALERSEESTLRGHGGG